MILGSHSTIFEIRKSWKHSGRNLDIDVRTSGDFYRMFVLERMGVKPDFYYMDGKRNRKSAHAASKRMETDYAE